MRNLLVDFLKNAYTLIRWISKILLQEKMTHTAA